MSQVVTMFVDPEKYKRSGLVAGGAIIQSVTLKRVSAMRASDEDLPIGQEACELRVRHRMAGFKMIHEKVLAVEIEGLLEFLRPKAASETKDHVLGSISVAYEVRYEFPEGPFPEGVAEALPDFGEVNGLYNVWPYLRARMQDLSSDMGIPTVLPTLRITPRKTEQQPSGKDPGSTKKGKHKG